MSIEIRYGALKPKDVSEITWGAVIEAWENGLSDREAAFHASKTGKGVTENEIKEWMEENPAISDLKSILQDNLAAMAKLTIAASLKKNDVKTAKWYLERKRASEFSTKAAVSFENAVVELTLADKEKALQDMIEGFTDGES